MKNKILIVVIYLFSGITENINAQSIDDIVWLSFNESSQEKCNIEDSDGNMLSLSKYRRKLNEKVSLFYVCGEVFKLNSKERIDTVSVNLLNNIKFWNLHDMNAKRDSLKDIYFFKKDVFKEIYLIESFNDKIIRYPVVWYTDFLIEN